MDSDVAARHAARRRLLDLWGELVAHVDTIDFDAPEDEFCAQLKADSEFSERLQPQIDEAEARLRELTRHVEVVTTLREAPMMAAVPWCSFHTFRQRRRPCSSGRAGTRSRCSLSSGITSPAFTLATYVHLIPDDLPDAAFLDEGWHASQAPERTASPPRRTAAA